MKRIGLTGSIASGKSTVADMLRDMGAFVIDADETGRALTNRPGSPVLGEIAAAFGAHMLTEEGLLDRKAMAALVFGDAAARSRLEAILHPAIRASMHEQEKNARGHNAVVYDVPLLFESGMDADMDEVWVVDAPRETRISRLAERNGWSPSEAQRRMAAQMPDAEKRARADVLIENGADMDTLRRKVAALWEERNAGYGSYP